MAPTLIPPAPAAPATPVPSLGALARLAYFLMFVGLLAGAVSGIGTFALGQAPMTQWVLMAHVGASPLFAVGLTLVALTWPSREARYGRFSWFLFWLLLLAGWVLIVSGVLPMTPLAGTEGQHQLYLIHRYSGIATAALALLHLLSLRPRR
ncbi:MAG: hypothetical protein AB7O66_23620 [Limisphaerales bacterium]